MARSETSEVLAYVRFRILQEREAGATWRTIADGVGCSHPTIMQLAKEGSQGPKTIDARLVEDLSRHWKFRRVPDLYIAATEYAEAHPELFIGDTTSRTSPDDAYPNLSAVEAVAIQLGLSREAIRSNRLSIDKGQKDLSQLEWLNRLQDIERGIQYALRNPAAVSRQKVAQSERFRTAVAEADAAETPKQKSERILREKGNQAEMDAEGPTGRRSLGPSKKSDE